MRKIASGKKAEPKPAVQVEHDFDLADELTKLLADHKTAEISGDDPAADDNKFGWVDVLTFCESPKYLGMNLHPWQRLILKIFYMGSRGNRNLKIMDKTEQRCTNCVWQRNTLREESPCLRCSLFPPESRESELKDIVEQGILDRDLFLELRDVELEDQFQNEIDIINADLIDDSDSRVGGSVRQQVLSKIGKSFNHLILVLGRRSGKSMLSAIICLYETYKLIEMGDPRKIYKVQQGDPIVVLNVAGSQAQAKDSVFDKMKGYILQSPYFKSKMDPDSMKIGSVRFLTAADIQQNAELKAQGLPPIDGSIYLLSGTSNSDTQVGKSVIVVVIDEMASMVAKDGSKLSDRQLYEKLRHSVWTFPRDFKIICISNPITTDGQFYELYEDSFRNDKILMFQLPTYRVNPGVPKSVLDEDKADALRKGGITEFIMNIEARFQGGAANPLIPADKIDEAFERGSRMVRIEIGNPLQLYYMHVDPAVSSDNYALAIVHVEEDQYRQSDYGRFEKVVYVDHVQIWTPDKATGTPVDIATCDTYIADMARRFHLAAITYDQFNSASSIQYLNKIGLPAMQTTFTSQYMQDIFGTLLSLFIEGRIVIYKNGPFAIESAEQLKFLQQKFNRRTYSVSAAEGHHDDIPACIAGASYQALTNRATYKSLPRIRTAAIPWR